MLAIDTNILVRYLTGDHPEQSAKARAIVDGNDVHVGDTVLLETEWVLRSVYGFPSREIVKALRNFLGLPHISVDSPAALARALDWAEAGMDFADALHLGRANDCEAFVTFDRKFIEAARAVGLERVRGP